jgi:hypothetical protein
MNKNSKTMFFFSVLITLVSAYACTTRVSEWALVNVEPTPYDLIYFNTDGKSPDSGFPDMEQAMQANLRFRTIDIDEATDEETSIYQQVKQRGDSKWALFYGNRLVKTILKETDINDLASSPIRDQIASEIKKGKLCVIVYLKSGNRDEDDKGAKAIRASLDKSPLKEIIPVVELGRDVTTERHFVDLLLKVESDLAELEQPMLFGVFGRFRVLEPLVGRGITEENIGFLIEFLTAECSCVIKSGMPGIDMLYTNRWDNYSPALLHKYIE